MNYKIGDKALNRAGRIFSVESMTQKDFGAGPQPYLVMKPCFPYDYSKDYRLFVPADNADNILLPLMNKKEADALIDSIPELEPFKTSSPRERKMRCQSVVAEGNRKDVMRIIKTLANYKLERQKANKTFSDFDQKLLSSLVTMIDDEIALAVGIQPVEVKSYVQNRIGVSY